MKKMLLWDVLKITAMYVVFVILIVFFDSFIPSIWVILGGYLVSLSILLICYYFSHKKHSKN